MPRKTPIKPRRLYQYAGVGVAGKYGVHLNSLVNVRRALVERVFNVEVEGNLVPTPRPEPGLFGVNMHEFSEVLLKCLPKLLPLSAEDFVNLYTGRRRVLYAKAAEEFIRSGVKPKHSHIKAFVKAEKIFITDKPDPAPRIIQPRNPVFNVAVGRFLKHAEKPLFKSIGKVFGGQTVYKGMNALATARKLREAWEQFTHPVAVGLDASRFDQHVSREALEWEHTIWPALFRGADDRKTLKSLLKQQLHNSGVAYADDGRIRYSVDGCRMSGDMNTSSGNCLIMCGLVWSYCRGAGLERYRLANNGDDCIVICEKHDLHMLDDLPKWFMSMGFKMKVESPVMSFERIDFCQTSPVWTQKGWVMCRNPHTAMSKDLHANCHIGDHLVRNRWLNAMHQGGKALTDGLPMWQSFYDMFAVSKVVGGDHGLNPLHESGLYSLMRNMRHENTPITSEARYSFWLAFGILPDQQVEFEKHCRNIILENLPYTPDAPNTVGDVFWLPTDKSYQFITMTNNKASNKNKTNKSSNKRPRTINTSVGSYANPGGAIIRRRNEPPRIENKSAGVRVSNSEYFADVATSAAGSTGMFPFNPTSLNWLAGIAKSYSKYRVHKLTFSYLPQVATTQGGYVDLGTFYDTEDAGQWIATGGDVLYSCPQFASGPPYAGGAVSTANNNVHDNNWFGLEVDTEAAHRTYPWLAIDSTVPVATGNLAIPVSVGIRAAGPGLATNTKIGRLIASYDIEFIQPVSASVNV